MARIRKNAIVNKSNTEKNKIWYIALYIRLSKDDGNDESLSVTNQRKILSQFVNSSFQEESVIADVYIDDGVSGTDYDRPDFQRMIHDVETGKVNCIICKNLSRAFRNYSDQGYFLEKFFSLHSTRFITLGDPKIDTFLNPEAVSGMEVPINGLMNDRFAYKTSSDVRRTFDTKRKNGEFIGAFAPYGYAKDPQNKNALVIDTVAAQTVRDIYQWFVYGDGSTDIVTDANGVDHEVQKGSLSKEGICRKLNGLGIPNPTMYKKQQGLNYKNPHAKKNDGLWMASSVSRILKNKMYAGTMVQGKQRVISYKVHDIVNVPEDEWYQVEKMHEAIVSLELFEKAMELHEKDTRRSPAKKENYLFSGLLRCADCAMSMTRRAAGSFVYYNCTTYKRKSKERCTKHSMRLDILESAVLTAIQKQIEMVGNLVGIVHNIDKAPTMKTKSVRLEHLYKAKKEELEKAESMLTELYVDWKNGDISREQYRKMRGKFEEQEEQLKRVIEHVSDEIQLLDKDNFCVDPYLQAFLKNTNITELSQGILTELVDTILIHEGGGITIQFKFDDQYKRIVDLTENNKNTLAVSGNRVS